MTRCNWGSMFFYFGLDWLLDTTMSTGNLRKNLFSSLYSLPDVFYISTEFHRDLLSCAEEFYVYGVAVDS
ncbi:hypothetical protein RR46_04623 [Papilio xuthus]|uniref:Uncharacterized protein n=1 Tax=Papilio xuthus TaxID=66420 RepID=A0A194Q5H9_PAPXU|nr:hypothetical protein RR46_04623 [Papilio xuthus]